MTFRSRLQTGCGTGGIAARSSAGWHRYTGTDADINIETAEPEFCEWRWIAPRELVDLAVPFKRDVYQTLMDSFSGLIEG